MSLNENRARRSRIGPNAPTNTPTITSAHIYTDGGCNPKTWAGGWGVAIYAHGYLHELHGGATGTTNNRMELQAVIEAIRFIDNPEADLRLHSDSQYVIKSLNEYVWGWKFRGWRLSANKEVKNKDLWIELDTLVEAHKDAGHPIDFRWVRGHNGNVGNHRADHLATAGIKLITKAADYEDHLSLLAQDD